MYTRRLTFYIMTRMEREKPITGEIYHIYNRGVDKRTIFEDDHDRIRFVHDLWEFNDKRSANNSERSLSSNGLAGNMYEVSLRTLKKQEGRDKLVDILAWCLMPNHFHLMLRQRVENGIPNFMRKLGTGYTNAFNIKTERVGSLFQGVYKFKYVDREEYLLYLPHYIHLNPVSLSLGGSQMEALKFLDSYRWSSFQDYCGKKNFPSLIDLKFINHTFGSPDDYRRDIIQWLKEGDESYLNNILLD